MKLFFYLPLLFLTFAVNGQVLYRNSDSQAETAGFVQSDANGSIIEFNLLDLEMFDAEPSRFGQAVVFRIPTDGDFLGIIGSPDLPVVRKMVLIPNYGDVELEVIQEETAILGDYRIAPWQERKTWSGQIPEYRINNDVYQSSMAFPAASVEIENTSILRDIRVAWVRFNPVRVNPVTGETFITTNITVRVKTTDQPGENELDRVPSGYTRSFLPIYNQVLGFQNDLDSVNGSYVFIGSTESLNLAQDLINWKKQKGYDVQLGDLSTIGGSVSEIDAWLEDAFNNWTNPPEYVMLVGDDYVVPSPQYSGSATHAADNQYAVVGTGPLPSMHIGRISGNDTDDLAYISWKIVMAEREPYQPAGDSWFDAGFSMACTDFEAPQEAYRIHQLFMAEALESTFYCAASGGVNPTLSAVTSDFNEGVSAVNYIGHGTVTGWVTSGFNISSISNLTNGRRMPWVFTIGCQNGEFDGYYCFTEAFLSEGTISDPKGAINVMGSSTNTPVGPGDTLQVHTFRGYFTEDIYHLGAAHTFGKAGCYTSFGSSGVDMINMAHVFGCPETDIFTDTSPISPLSNSHSPTVNAGSFQVTVTDGTETLIEGALVGVYYADTGELLDGAYTDASGVANFTIESLPGANAVTITSTVHNRVPAITYANTTGTEETETAALPVFHLANIHPNPISSTGTISFSTSVTGNVEIEIYDIAGRNVTTVHSGNMEAGIHSLLWQPASSTGTPIPNGLYFISLTTPQGRLTRSFAILR